MQSATYAHPWCFVVIQTNVKINSKRSRSAEVNDSRSALTIHIPAVTSIHSLTLVIYLARSVSAPWGSILAVLGY